MVELNNAVSKLDKNEEDLLIFLDMLHIYCI